MLMCECMCVNANLSSANVMHAQLLLRRHGTLRSRVDIGWHSGHCARA